MHIFFNISVSMYAKQVKKKEMKEVNSIHEKHEW